MSKLYFPLAGVLLGLTLNLPAAATLVSAQPVAADDVSAMVEAVSQTTPTPAADVPDDGIYYSAQEPDGPPMPGNMGHAAWNLGDNVWLLDDLDAAAPALSPLRMMSTSSLSFPGDGGDGGDGGTNSYTPGFSMGTPIDTNDLYLEITNVINGSSYLNLHNATNQVYAIWGATNLPGGWNVETELFPTGDQTNVLPFSIQNLDRQILFLRAEDWTGVTENGNTTPDWWFYLYYGTTALSDTNLDSGGVNTLGYDYSHGLDPNVISFTVRLGNQNFNTTTATGSYLVTAGTPSYGAVLVNDPNLDDALWLPYDGNIAMNLGPTDGVYQVTFGLKGRATNSTATWMGTEVTLNRQTPQITLTSPTNLVVAQPWLQLQGYAAMPLTRVTYDLNGQTNQLGFIIENTLDTNTLTYTKDYFQCFDLPLVAGSNAITLHVVDPAGNSFTTNFNVTLDYATATNPVIQLAWPQNGASLCGSGFTVRGWTEDAAAQVSATITDNNGDTNTVTGTVERTGNVWVENLPLNPGTNWVSLVVTNFAGLSSVTNFMVVKSDMALALTTITGDLWLPTVSVGGTISDDTAAVWVNGVPGTNNGDGTWNADNVPVSAGGVASFDVSTVSADATDSATSTNADKPEGLKLDACTWHYENMDNFGTLHRSGTLGWTAQGGGTEHDEIHSGTDWYANDDSTIAPDGSITLTHYTDSDGVDHYSTNNGMADLPWSYGALSGSSIINWPVGSNHLFSTFYSSGTAKVFYHTGGQQAAGSESLYAVSGGYLTEDQVQPFQQGPDYLRDEVVNADVPPPQPVVAGFGENLGADRTAYQVLPNPPQVEETLLAGVPRADFVEQAGRYSPVSQTYYPALTDTNRNRTTLGVGEQVYLYFTPTPWFVFDWTTTGGGLSATLAAGNTTLTAPSNAAPSVTVTATIRGGKSISFPAFKVVEPAGIDHAKITGTNSYPLGTAGAGMGNAVWIAPTSVSFYRVNVMEVGEDAINIWGFFADTNYFGANPAKTLHHNPNPNWAHLAYDNHFTDSAYFGGYSPWAAGGFEWNIPQRWQVDGSGITNSMSNCNQVFSIDGSGTASVSKYGNSIQRTTNNVITTN